MNAKWPLLLLLLAACGAGYWWLQSDEPGTGLTQTTDGEDEGTEDPESPDLVGDGETPVERAKREERERVAKAKRDVVRRKRLLTSGSAKERDATLKEVAALRKGAVAYLDEVIECLWHEDAAVRKLSADVLLVMGEAAIQPTIDAVAARVREEQGSAMSIPGYVEAGGMLLRAGAPAYGPVARAMPQPNMLWLASLTFGSAGGPDRSLADAVPILREHLASDDDELRYWSVVHLRKGGRDAVEALPDLADLLQSDKQRLRQVTIKTLGELGPVAESILQDLERHRDESGISGNERRATLEAIAKIRGE